MHHHPNGRALFNVLETQNIIAGEANITIIPRNAELLGQLVAARRREGGDEINKIEPVNIMLTYKTNIRIRQIFSLSVKTPFKAGSRLVACFCYLCAA